MKALTLVAPSTFEFGEAPAPTPSKGEVLVNVKACGICGSDLSYIKIGGIMRKPGGVTPIGHEAAGEIVAVGDQVKGVAVGQRVVINPMMTPSYIGSGGPEGAGRGEQGLLLIGGHNARRRVRFHLGRRNGM